MAHVAFYEGFEGRYLDTLELSTHVVYSLFDMGQVDFDVVFARNYKFSERLIRPGNMIRVIKAPELYLPEFPGIIGDNQSQVDDKIKLTCFSPHFLYTWRESSAMKLSENDKIFKGSSGTIMKRAVDLSNAAEDLLVRYGNIDESDHDKQETFDGIFYDHMKTVCEANGMEWQFRTYFEGGKLRFYLDFVQRVGEDLTNIVLREGVNFEKSAGQAYLTQTGPIINMFAGISSASTPEETIVDVQDDDISRAKYRLRQGSETFNGVTEAETVKAHTAERLNQTKDPTLVPSITVQNRNNIFQHIRLGNVLTLQYLTGVMSSVNTGLQIPARVTVMDHDDAYEGKMRLAMTTVR